MTTSTHAISDEKKCNEPPQPIVHYANADLTGSLCGAPVFGVLTNDGLDCVVCADLRAAERAKA